jgi:putative ABC transport system permease protein
MFDLDKWQEIFASIGKHKLRTLLTSFGVAWGIFMLVLLLGAGRGLHNGIYSQFSGDAINSIWIRPGKTSIPFRGLQKDRQIKLTTEDYNYLLDQFSEIEQLSGKYFLEGSKFVTYEQTALSYPINGIHPDGAIVESLSMRRGRFFNQKDLDEFRKVAVIGQNVENEMFKNIDPVGESIVIDGASYTIIGVFYDEEGEWAMRRIYLPITTVQKVYSSYDRIDQLILAAGNLSADEMLLLENTITKALQERKIIAPDDRKALNIFNMSTEYQQLVGLMTAINGIIWIVGIFSMIAGVIGVSNIMLIIVKDRTKEIGIRKAIGATPASIVGMIFQESIFITAIAGYVGLGMGIMCLWLMQGVDSEFFKNPQVDIRIAISATLVLILAGVLAGLLPAIQAARINPVTAIKSD